MAKKRILFFVDSRQRDMYPAISISNEIGGYFDFFISNFTIWEPVLNSIKPHVVVLNHMNGRRNRIIAATVKEYGGKVVIIPTEGRPNNVYLENWYAEQSDPYFFDLFLSWNNALANKVEKSIVVGSPRHDVYRSDRRKHRALREEIQDRYLIDSSKKTVLFTSSFPQAKFAYRNSEFNRKDWQDLGVTTVKGKEDPDLVAREDLAALNEFSDFVLAAKYGLKDFNVILKPHPMEDFNWWRSSKLKIISDIPIYDLISCADILIAKNGCLTHQDAWMSGVPSYLIDSEYMFDSEYEGAARDAYDLSKKLLTYNDIIDCNGKLTTKHYEYLSEWGFISDGPSASWRCGKEILAISANAVAPNPDYSTALELMMAQNAQRNTVDYAGHYKKNATLSDIKEMLTKID